MRQDAHIAERTVLRLINVPLTDGQFDALVSFTYNLGGGAFQRSTIPRKINREEHSEVPEQFMRWVWAAGRKLKGACSAAGYWKCIVCVSIMLADISVGFLE